MQKMYVLTNETDNNVLLGVYSSESKAFNSMLSYMADARVRNIDEEEVGTRYHFLLDDGEDTAEVVCYIEECDLDDPVYMEMNKMRQWN